MKYPLIFCAFLLMCGCTKDTNSGYPLTQYTWTTKEVIHIPDNVGFYSGQYGVLFQFKVDGTYIVSNTPAPIEAEWYWIDEGVKFKVDLTGISAYNDVYTILTMNDTLLHFTRRVEGEPDTTGNYWEIKYRPN